MLIYTYPADTAIVYPGIGGGSGPVAGTTPIVELRNISSAEEAAKELQLANVPFDTAQVILEVRGGPPQFSGFDYATVGDIVSWDSLGLDGILAENDEVRILYWI